MTDLTNAPPLPEPHVYTDPHGIEWIGKPHYDTLRTQLEQSPMRESAIIEGLERHLAEARGEIERLKARIADVNNSVFGSQGFFMEPNCVDAIEKNKKHGNEQWQRAEAATARADACEKDAKRYRYLRSQYEDRQYAVFAWDDDCAIGGSDLDAAIDAAISGAPT